jgi:proline iminopeptidase
MRGTNQAAPVLLWLHRGPGGAERPLFRYFNGKLEKHFLVAYWDQRGAGRSLDAKSNPQDLTIAQHIRDLDQVVDHLRRTLGQDKIVLMGHSWGAALGLLYVQAHPDKVSTLVLVITLGRNSKWIKYVFSNGSIRTSGASQTQLLDYATHLLEDIMKHDRQPSKPTAESELAAVHRAY